MNMYWMRERRWDAKEIRDGKSMFFEMVMIKDYKTEKDLRRNNP
jgi:hypothetical protein